eukprot:352226-Chlamydomonas_euryale.AAC.1
MQRDESIRRREVLDPDSGLAQGHGAAACASPLSQFLEYERCVAPVRSGAAGVNHCAGPLVP